MAFREKSAWVMAAALLAGGVYYFWIVASLSAGGTLAPPVIPGVIGYTILLVIIAVAGNIVAAVSAPQDAAAVPDERDGVIVDRAARVSSYVLAVGVVAALGGYLLVRQGDVLFYAVFGALMLSSLAEYLVQIYLYRRGV